MCFFFFMQVNGYDSVRVVDSLYRSKYFLTSKSGFCDNVKPPSSTKCLGRSDDSHFVVLPENHVIGDANLKRKTGLSVDNQHKVTILNLPEEVTEHSNENQTRILLKKTVLPSGEKEDEASLISSGEICVPILPWINGDGTVNNMVYKGVRRRVLGIVMQNPGILEVHAFLNSCFCL